MKRLFTLPYAPDSGILGGACFDRASVILVGELCSSRWRGSFIILMEA